MVNGFLFVFINSSLTYSTIIPQDHTSPPDDDDYCVLPPYPEHGRYIFRGHPSAIPGDSYPSVKLEVSCDIGYLKVNNTDSIICLDGEWSESIPTCVPSCPLINDKSIEYRCDQSGSLKGSQKCESLVPAGTIVTPICRSPDYEYLPRGVLPKMHCEDGTWNYNPTCVIACGTIPPSTSSDQVGLPWHAGIYNKLFKPYMQICGGSLVTTTRVISAAHCFWDDATRKVLPANQYVVAVGKLYRPYNEPRDINSQKSNVVDIKIAHGFQGEATSYQDDIAIVIVETPFVYQPSVRPICLDFDKNFDKTQLTDENVGKAAGWNINDKKRPLPSLKIVDLPYIRIEDCFNISIPNFRQYLTSDKFCAGSNNGTLLCRGDTGGGLAFPELNGESQRYYLRGVLSVGPTNEDACDTFNAFTSIIKHEDFIKQYLI